MTVERDVRGRFTPRVPGVPREADGTLPKYAWPGGYPMAYYTRDGLTICATCASDPDTSDPVVAGEVYWEGPALVCEDGSSCRGEDGLPSTIESAYGVPEDEARACPICGSTETREISDERQTITVCAECGSDEP